MARTISRTCTTTARTRCTSLFRSRITDQSTTSGRARISIREDPAHALRCVDQISSRIQTLGDPMRSFFLFAMLAGIAMAQPPQGGGRGGGGRGNAGISNLTLITTAWPDRGMIPARYTQAGAEISPAIQWSAPPAGTVSYVLIFTDADTVVQGSTDGLLHRMVWNIPGTATGIAQGRPDGFEMEDGMRQISASGSRY